MNRNGYNDYNGYGGNQPQQPQWDPQQQWNQQPQWDPQNQWNQPQWQQPNGQYRPPAPRMPAKKGPNLKALLIVLLSVLGVLLIAIVVIVLFMTGVLGGGSRDSEEAAVTVPRITAAPAVTEQPDAEPNGEPAAAAVQVTDDLVTDAYSAEYAVDDGMIEIHIPQIDLPGDTVTQINAEIYDRFIEDADHIASDTSSYGIGSGGIRYTWAVNGDILSLVIVNDFASIDLPLPEYYVTNIDLNGNPVTRDEVLAAAGYTETQYADAIAQVLQDPNAYALGTWNYITTEDGGISLGEEGMLQRDETLAQENLQASMPYLNADGRLCTAITLVTQSVYGEFADSFMLPASDTGNSANTGAASAGAISAADAVVGGTVTFGAYEQDNNTADGAEPIEWRVLAVDGGRAMLISSYALEAYPKENLMLSDYSFDTWETCDLRAWLNDDFYNTAFTAAEQALILTTEVENPDTYYGTDDAGNYVKNNTGAGITDLQGTAEGGSPTSDKVFLLSLDEAQSLFSTAQTTRTIEAEGGGTYDCRPDLQCTPTESVTAENGQVVSNQYITTESGGSCCWWWLRSTGGNTGLNCVIDVDGFSQYYYDFHYVYPVIRPVIWVEVS